MHSTIISAPLLFEKLEIKEMAFQPIPNEKKPEHCSGFMQKKN